MKFQDFAGTTEEGRRSDAGAEVVSSTASQASRRDARGFQDHASLKEALAGLESDLAVKNGRIAQIELRLAELRRAVRGRTLPPLRYNALCDEQTELARELRELRTACSDVKVRRASLLRDITAEHGKDNYSQKLDVTNRLLRLILVELRSLTRPPHDRGDGGETPAS
jgi:hypothetical protein